MSLKVMSSKGHISRSNAQNVIKIDDYAYQINAIRLLFH